MIRAALRRILVILVVVLGGTAAISAALGALAGKDLLRSLATGYYIVAAVVLLGSLAFGLRGPMRVERTDDPDARPVPLVGTVYVPGRRRVRKAGAEERREGRSTSLGLFLFGVLLLFLGAAIDPTRHAF